ncbi:uncharacterized protein EKO05_0003567 [Ascochyta rabiei]|uniref:Uncharacterized protein n=1 Tax=Didymella rabiei TaxID=5454 RepID=A0A163AAI3_DIDRA|nr:uncharacterized protein EKO05_0003567 [Ascochyta rabiei]KZM21080.1 hypothetical protein ST47_g7771 [Ascochyta rabiei]UPX13038.1 hypothetical protein EKO05_0003567 [Ascochyta rabiei]
MFRSSISIFGIRTPRPEQDVENSPAPPSQSRFARFSTNARTIVGSSVYSQSPGPSRWKSPKMPSMGFARRPTSADLDTVIDESNGSNSALASHSAASYVGAISQEQIRTPEQTYNRHPADVPLPHQDPFVDSEVQQLADEVNGPRRHRRRKRRKQHRSDHWKRKRSDRGKLMPFVRGTAARGKLMACIISGTFLLSVLTIYLAIALTNKDVGQEIHVLFILLLLSITIFFCHSLIRLCMLLLNPPYEVERQAVPNLTAPEGFQPIVPIPVRLGRDDELDSDNDMADLEAGDPEKEVLPPPPPAYGLWRSSVRVDPNLLHWQRVEENRAQSAISMPSSRDGGVVAASTHDSATDVPAEGPRPPSYVSEDGVSYITEAAPRSVAPAQDAPAPSGVHPAWRSSYVMSEIRPGEVPASMGRR